MVEGGKRGVAVIINGNALHGAKLDERSFYDL